MKRIGSTTSRRFSIVLALAVLAVFAVQPASATIYQFAIPVGDLQAALSAAASASVVPFPDRYAFYDVFIRAGIAGDGGSGVFMTSPTNVNGTPFATNTPSADAWTDVINGTDATNDNISAPGDTGHLSINFKISPSDTRTPIFTSNVGAITNTKVFETGGNASENLNLKLGNSATAMTVFINSPGSYVGQAVQLEFFAVAYRFTDSAWSSTTPTKGVVLSGHFTETAFLTPEPMSFVSGAGGLILLSLVGLRRKRRTS